MALVLGTAGLPHVLMRFYTVPTAKEARKSVVYAITLIGVFYLFSLVLGFGAAALVGADVIAKAPAERTPRPRCSPIELGGTLLLGFISAVAFATILAVVAGLTITASASFAHDVYANVIKKNEVSADAEVRVARIAAVVIGVFAILGGILAKDQNIAFLVALAFAVAAASANLPTILYSLFWKALHHPGRPVEHLRRSDLVDRADPVLAGGVGFADGDDPGRGLRLVPAGQPRHRVHSAGVCARHRRHPDRAR
jgi:cation/acetate symporter